MVSSRHHVLLLSIASALLLSCTSTTEKSTATPTLFAYQNENLPVEQRVEDLISRMTLSEKVSQLFDKAPAIERLQVPAYKWWNEALHGIARAGTATVFPQAIGMAATFDDDLMLEIGTAISDEGRAKNNAFLAENNRAMYTGLTYWSPNINIFRDPRWGRGQETYGEDPYLTSQIAINFVKGLQGDNANYLKSVATLKHFAVHSGPEISRHSDNYNVSAKDLNETYLAAFRDVIAQTNVASVMCAYNSVNGSPACGNKELIQQKLRGELNFKGYIVSDCGAIADFYDKNAHHLVDSEAKAAAMAVNTGTDLNCGDHRGNTFSYLTEAVQQGLISESAINKAVTRLFLARFKLGMFDKPEHVAFSAISMDVVGSKKHLALSQQAAEKSLVLLKNNNLLPLKPTQKIALIGPNADNQQILVGNYNGTPVNPITPKQALEKRLGKNNIFYAPGSSITGNIYTHYQPITAQHFFHIDHAGKQQAGLIAEYYPDAHFNRQPVRKQIDKNIDFTWQRSPINNQIEEEFAVKWHGLLKPLATAKYRFQAKNLMFTLNGKTVDGELTLSKNVTYDFSAEAKFSQYWHSNIIQPSASLSWLNNADQLAKQAINAANSADVIVFVGGITAALEGEEMSLEIDGFSHGDRTHINLPLSQQQLLKQLKQTGKPIVLVNMSGSAMALNWADKNIPAIVQGFYPGETTGTALTRLLLGDYSPSGKLPITFYKSVADLPAFNNYAMTNRTYKYYTGDVLYPFGYGLSYADMQLQNMTAKLSSDSGNVEINSTIINNSSFSSDEVMQIYISMPDAPVTTPQRQLVNFKRINVPAGAKKQVHQVLLANQLSYIDQQGNAQSYHGKLFITVGFGQGIKIAPSRYKTTEIKLP